MDGTAPDAMSSISTRHPPHEEAILKKKKQAAWRLMNEEERNA